MTRTLSSLLSILLASASLPAAADCLTTAVYPDAALPAARVGTPYAQRITASGVGAPPYAFSLTSGAPADLALAMQAQDDTSANLQGTPARAGRFLVTVTATDAGGCSGGRTYALDVERGEQAVAFTSAAPTDATLGGAPYAVGAAATSGLPVAFSIDPSSAAVCALAGTTVDFQGAGTCVVVAAQGGDANWNAAPPVQQSFAVARRPQTIAFDSPAPTNAVVGGPAYTVAATASSGLAVEFSVDPAAAAVCSISGNRVDFHAVGTCTIDANQAGDASFAPAPPAQQSFAVGKGSQSITFASLAPANAAVGGAPYAVAATASSGLAVQLAIDPSAAAVCSIAGDLVSFQRAGTCIVNADQPGDANWNAAPQAQQGFAVARGAQTIAFTSTPPLDARVGSAPYAVAATSASGLPVTIAIDASAAGVCSIAGNTVGFHGAGTCIVNADQPGDANWNAAPRAQQGFAVGKGTQTIAFTSTPPLDARVGGAPYTVAAMAASGLPVTIAIDASAAGVCSIAADTVSFHGAGTCIVNADQPGDANWNAAPRVQQGFTVGRGTQTIAFTSTPPLDARVGGAPYTVAATAVSGLPVTFAIDASAAGVCSVAGDTVSFHGTGTCVVNADQPGDANWEAAPRAQQSFEVTGCVSPAVGEVVFHDMPGGTSVCIENPAGSNTEYVYLPINRHAWTNANLRLTGHDVVAAAGPPAPIAPPGANRLVPAPPPPDAGVFAPDAARPADLPVATAASLVRPKSAVAAAPEVGDLMDINASIGGCSVAPDVRKGRVAAVTQPQSPGQQRLYAVQEVVESNPGQGDWHPPVPGGYSIQALQNTIDAFVQAPPGDTPTDGSLAGQAKIGMMDTMTGSFGALTDVDGNGGILVFFTPKLNQLSPPASSIAVPGTFQPRDLFSAASCPGSNEAEILYMMVPDPAGVVNSNVRTISSVYGQAVPTLVHNATHLFGAARRLYFSGAGSLEAQWLDEALAWTMQEVAFYNASWGLAPRGNIVLSDLTTGAYASRRVAAFNTHANAGFGANRIWFYQMGASGPMRLGPLRQAPYSAPAIAGVHDLTQVNNFAIAHLFLRYALDRRNTGDAALLGALINTNRSGLDNLQHAFGVDANEWLRDFLVAVYTDDAVAGVDPKYVLPSWNYRSLHPALYGGYALVTSPLADGVPMTFVLSPGGGTRYVRFGVAPGATATLELTEDGASPSASITTALVRTK